MAPPLPTVQNQGMAAVNADNFNTFVQTVANFAQLRTFTALNNMAVSVLGGSAAGDGLQGMFYYSTSSTAADNNSTVIVPNGAVQGAWLRLAPATNYLLQTPLTGFSITISGNVRSLILNPAGTLAAGTITLPLAPTDSQIVTIASNQIVTALSLAAVGQSLSGALTSIAANGFASYQYVASVTTWFRVG